MPEIDQSLDQFLTAASKTGSLEGIHFESNPFIVHASVYALADKYDMAGVMDESLNMFKARRFKPRVFVRCLDTVYSSTPLSNKGLRARAVCLVQENYNNIMHDKQCRETLKKLFVKHGQLGWDFAANLFKRNEVYCKRWETTTHTIERNGHLTEGPDEDDEGVCFCSMTKICGSGVCSKAAVNNRWACENCEQSERLEVVETTKSP